MRRLTIPTPSSHRLRRGLPGYLILFAPHALAPQRQYLARWSPSPPVFLPISTNFTSTPGIPPPPPVLKSVSFKCTSMVEPWTFTPDITDRLRALTPSNSEQRLHPPYYRGCWHGVSRCFLRWYRQIPQILTMIHFFPSDRILQPEGLHHPRCVAASGLPPLRNIPHCCLP